MRDLVERAQGGDREAFGALVLAHQQFVYNLAWRALGDAHEAQDAAQEAFLRAWQALPSFRGQAQFRTWLYRIVTNVCLDHLRRRQARPEDQAPEIHLNRQDEGSRDFFEFQRELRPGLDPERRLMGNEIRTRIAKAMERLSPRERVVFEMKHYQGLKLRAIGDALGTTEETVKNSLFRATRKLRLELGELR